MLQGKKLRQEEVKSLAQNLVADKWHSGDFNSDSVKY